jgi:hypothetical protein
MSAELDYNSLISRTRELISTVAPEDSVVAVVSKGDPELLKLGRREGWHFPRTESGAYAGHHPADDADAVARLESVRRAGASFLVVPATASWWLDHYSEFGRHLRSQYRVVAEEAETALIFSLEPRDGDVAATSIEADEPLLRNIRAIATGLLPADSTVVVAAGGDWRLLNLQNLATVELVAGDVGPDEAGFDGGAIVAQLESHRRRGARYLLFPKTAEWWLERYAALRLHVAMNCSLVTEQRHVCSLYELDPPRPARSDIAGDRRG